MPTPEPDPQVPHPHTAPHPQPLSRLQPPPPTRVRDRLESVGPEALSDHDLLSVLIGSPPPEQSERGATHLLRVFGSLRGLARATPRELHLLKGTGGAMSKHAALRLTAAFALGRRLAVTPLERGAKLASTKAIFDHFHDGFVALLSSLKKKESDGGLRRRNWGWGLIAPLVGLRRCGPDWTPLPVSVRSLLERERNGVQSESAPSQSRSVR